jgi:hypothetical protein
MDATLTEYLLTPDEQALSLLHSYRHHEDGVPLERIKGAVQVVADTEIIKAAKSADEVIVTHDLDYGHLLAFSGEAAPSVIMFRRRFTSRNSCRSDRTNGWFSGNASHPPRPRCRSGAPRVYGLPSPAGGGTRIRR